MKLNLFLIIAIISMSLTACDKNASDISAEGIVASDTVSTTELQIDSDVLIENGDTDVALLNQEEDVNQTHPLNHSSEINVVEDMTLFTPEDIALLDNIGNQDWGFEEDPTWILRFDDDMLIIGQENGQVTDVLRYHITAIDHSQQSMIIHIVERINEHSQLEESSMILNYYCELIVEGDTLTYKNKINDTNQLTETVWIRK